MSKAKIIAICKQLPINGKKRIKCCGDDVSRVCMNKPEAYQSFCFRSGCPTYTERKSNRAQFMAMQQATEQAKEIRSSPFKMQKESTNIVSQFPIQIVGWLSKGGLHKDMWIKYKFRYNEKYDRLLMPLMFKGKRMGLNCRAVDKYAKIKYIQSLTDYAPKGLMHQPDAWTGRSKTIVLTEDMVSAIRIAEATDHVDVACILGTTVNSNKLLYLVSNYDHVHLWLDGDKAGIDATEKWLCALECHVEKSFTIVDGYDPKHLSDGGIVKHLEILKEKA